MPSSGYDSEGNRPSAEFESANNAGSGSGSTKFNKNALGNKSDVAWSHGTCVVGTSRKIKCNYYEKVTTESIYRVKHRLARTQKDVGACRAANDKVKKQMWDIVVGLQQNLIKKKKNKRC